MAGQWLDVHRAALELGLSTDAVRKRIARGTLVSEERDGRRVVWLDDGGTKAGQKAETPGGANFELVEELRAQNAYLREVIATRDEEIRRRDHLIMSALSHIPELEAPDGRGEEGYDDGHESRQEPLQHDESPDEGYTPTEETPEPQTGSQRSARRAPWWKRFFGGG